MKTLCIIPVYNEELNLKDTLASVRMHNFGVDKFLFVNSGSTDKSSQILNESEFEILNIKKNRGIGYVIIKGIDYCIENNFDVLTIIHGGNKMDTKDFLPILNPILNDNFDCVWGSRFINNTSINMPGFRKLSGRWLSSLVSKFYKIKVTEARLGHTETGLADRAIFGNAPQMPTGLDPDVVVTKMLEAVLEKKNLISSAEFS